MYSTPRTHLGPFQAYSCGTTRRTGKPCSAVSGSPSLWVAKIVRSASEVGQAQVGAEAVLGPDHDMGDLGCGRREFERACGRGTPPHSAPSMLNFVTQCRSATTVANGSAENSSWFQQCLSPSAVAPKTRNSQRSGLNLGTGP